MKILVLDGMWNKALATVRSLGGRGLYTAAGESTRFSPALFSRFCSKAVIYPCPEEQPELFLKALEKELKRQHYDVLLPMEYSTQVLLTEKEQRHRFQSLVRIPFPVAELTKKINNKAFAMQYASSVSIEVPKTVVPESETCLYDITLNYPVLIKPRVSSGSRGIARVDRKEDIVNAYQYVNSRYPLPIIQEHIPKGGDSFGVGMLFNKSSELRAAFVYKKLREYPVSGGPSTLRESVVNDDLVEISSRLLKSLGWTGIAHLEYKVDPRDGKPKLLEVNPRFWGSLSLAIEAGVDFPYLLCKMAIDGDIEPVMRYSEGVQCRVLIPGDLLHFIYNPERFRLVGEFFNFKIKDDIISMRDPLPMLGRLCSVIPLLTHKKMRRLLWQ